MAVLTERNNMPSWNEAYIERVYLTKFYVGQYYAKYERKTKITVAEL